VKRINSITAYEYEELSYESEIMDWVNEDTGEQLSKYEPELGLIHILNNNIDSELG